MSGDFAYAMQEIREAAEKAERDAGRWAHVIRTRANRGQEPIEDYARIEAKAKETARQLRDAYALLEASRADVEALPRYSAVYEYETGATCDLDPKGNYLDRDEVLAVVGARRSAPSPSETNQ